MLRAVVVTPPLPPPPSPTTSTATTASTALSTKTTAAPATDSAAASTAAALPDDGDGELLPRWVDSLAEVHRPTTIEALQRACRCVWGGGTCG